MDQIPTAPPQRSIVAQDGPYFTPMTVRPEITNRREIVQTLIRDYPPAFRDNGIGGQAIVWFSSMRPGRRWRPGWTGTSGHDELDAVALKLGRIYEFTPAYNREEPTHVWVRIPITFEVR